eukprot:CAMPEP_0182451164 /NCGR_PEP_ID=MMETSP1172-20130603/43570_1 /TAXON_ID=708627 /ORGANISM="Timspurckia oligopyrenoides, Strain CCMP3278" /LENGTH=441 /DNA_ID=CAMNT_0024648913 /DNA_START=281 /DNA_END=1606 /DNA_ORIENTATION=+
MSSDLMKSHYPYVVVGGGVAAGYAAKEFVAQGVEKDSVLIVSKEAVAPYERPALSKAFLFADPPARLPGFHTSVGGGGERQAPEWYVEKGIHLLLDTEVSAVDVASKSITTGGGSKISADNLILATGASPVQLTMLPGSDLEGIYTLREYADGLELYDALKANEGKTVAVIGGGYIGMEVGAAAALMGVKVKMIFPEEHMMPRLFTAGIASKYEDVYRKKGIELLNKGRVCKEFVGVDGKVTGVTVCKDDKMETVACDLVVVGVGARPNTSLITDQLEMENGGVKVDSTMQSSVPGVYAVGDISSFGLSMYEGRRTRMEHVAHARASAACAVRSAMSKPQQPYDYLPYFYSRVFDLSWQFFGDSPPVSDKCYTVEIGEMNPQLLCVWVEHDKAVGVFIEAPSAEDTTTARKIATARPTITKEKLESAASVADALSVLSAGL